MDKDRRETLVAESRNQLATLRGTSAAFHHLLHLDEGDILREDIILGVCDFIDERNDCSDFALHSLIRLLYQFPDTLGESLRQRVEATVLGFKYWPDELGVDSLCTWSENHQILYASGAYLMGQMFPAEIFPNSGHNGRQKMVINRPRILRWLDLRFRTGFSEWLSNVYYDEDFIALLSLVDFCEDVDIQRRATIVIDSMLLDLALNSFQGINGSTHGRSYEEHKKWASREGIASTVRLLFGTGNHLTRLNLSAPCFALSPHYQMPKVIDAIAHDTTPYTNHQRMGIKLAEAHRWGLDFHNFEDGMVFLSLEAYLHPRTANLMLRMMDAYRWWQNSFFEPIARYRGMLVLLSRLRLLSPLLRLVERDVCRNTREEVNFTTHRTRHYMLSSAQDYRPGYGGDQQHIWQATLGPDAVCFSAHPAKREGPTPDYWTGEGTLPRVAQVENVLLAVYNINTNPALYVTNRLIYTHAWLPKDKFDQVVEQNGWIFARKGGGYLALHSRNSYRWQDQDGEDRDREVIAEGKTNIWLCELGSQESYDSFDAFIAAISNAPLVFNGLRVDYTSPSQGRITFGWRGKFRKNGKAISLKDFPRYDNTYVQAPFPAQRLEVHCGQESLVLNWDKPERVNN